MDVEINMFLLVSAGLCFIIIIIISIFNFFRISNLETDTDNLQISLRNETESNIQTVMDEDDSNIKQELDELKHEMESNINSNVKYIVESQQTIDSNQNMLIDKNELDIFNIGSNITHVIEPTMLVFDGQFKSLEGDIEGNDAEIAQLSTQIASQAILNDQFSNQNSTLKTQLDAIVAKDFQQQINNVISDITFNTQLINNKYTSLSNMDYTLLQSNIDTASNLNWLSSTTSSFASIVNDHMDHN
tara:strand:+ start:1337 stop:2071 length:735 start_codon:yes stop_codon:yes gene_type:complete